MDTLRFALIGNPVAQSKSPIMHHAAFEAMGLPHRYEALRVQDAELEAHMNALRAGTWNGFNVTIPHKQAVLRLVDDVDAIAAMIGAANTITRSADGKILRAYNTDVPALGEELRDLAGDRSAAPSDGGCAIVLGSGGAARCAVAAAVLYMGVREVYVRARAFDPPTERGRLFSNELVASMKTVGKDVRIIAEPLAGTPSQRAEARCTCIVQATSAGMVGAEAGDAVAESIDWQALTPSCIALDVVYNPPSTPFLRAAESAGIRSKGGIGMLARQGALALEQWLGRPPPFNAMLAALT
jgi:shikimate dehydrogenase